MTVRIPKREAGQGMVEYALILVFIAIVVIAILMQVGPQLNRAFGRVIAVLQSGGVVISSGAITDVTTSYKTKFGGGGTLTVKVTVSQKTDLTVTGDGIASKSKPNCSGTCIITIPNAPGTGFVTVTDSVNGEAITIGW